MKSSDVLTEAWEDYELLDAGGGRKLERWGKIITIRPEIQAYFHSGIPFSEWEKMAHWEFKEKKGTKGVWRDLKQGVPRSWTIKYKSLRFHLELTKFKHLGLFPEQRINWDFIDEHILEGDKVLNLFAYSGAASCVARGRGADVVHVDSVKAMLTWAKKNMEISRLLNLRWVHEDALKFIQREVKRGNKYDALIMDPPAWGIGAGGERWKLEDQIDSLLAAAASVLSEKGFLILNTYSPSIDQETLQELVSIYFPDCLSEVHGLHMETSTSKRVYFGELVRVISAEKEDW